MVEVSIHPLREDELPGAGRIVRLAFGTFLGNLGPGSMTDADVAADTALVRTRWHADPTAAFAADVDGRLAGSVIAVRWGSVGYFGPLTVHPDYWNLGIGKHLLEPVLDLFAAWGVTHAGLFTFAQSAKHLHLYQHFGFWPRFLTAIMSRPVGAAGESAPAWARFSALAADERAACLAACHALTGTLYPGLDVTGEINSVQAQQLGETVLLWDGDRLAGFAVCHCGAGTEAGAAGRCYIKVGAVRSGPDAPQAFARLLRACDALAAERGLIALEAGINLGRHEAYRALLAAGFRTQFQGVAMHRPNEPGYNRPDVYLIDDWR